MHKYGRFTLTLLDGREVKVTANYMLLSKLRDTNKAVYQHYNEAFKDLNTEPDYSMAMIFYAAYVMGLIDDGKDLKEAIPEEEFLDLLPFDRPSNMELVRKLVAPNQAKASTKRS